MSHIWHQSGEYRLLICVPLQLAYQQPGRLHGLWIDTCSEQASYAPSMHAWGLVH